MSYYINNNFMNNPDQITNSKSNRNFEYDNNFTNSNKDNYLLLPQSQEAEQSVLGAILAQNDSLNKIVEILQSPDAFYRPAHQIIYSAILKIYEKNEAIDPITVSDYLTSTGKLEEVGGRYYLGLLLSHSPLAVNVEKYANIVVEKYLLRQIISIGSQISKIGYEEPNAKNALERSEQLVYDLAQKKSGQSLTLIGSLVNDTWQRLEEREQHKGQLLGLDTGYYDLNALTSGFQKSDLIIIAARPSMGKTALALNIGLNSAVKYKKSIVVFSLEMSKEQVVQRMVCTQAGVDANRMRFGNLQESDWTKLGVAFGELGDSNIFIDDSPLMTVMEMKAKSRRLKAEIGKLDLVVVDYLQLMEGSRSDNRAQEISDISRGLKTLARELDVPVVALSQLSRAVEARQNKRPMLSDLRESGSIEQDADIVMFIYRDEYYNSETVDKGTAEVQIAKQRNGPTGLVKLLFQPHITKFQSLAKTIV